MTRFAPDRLVLPALAAGLVGLAALVALALASAVQALAGLLAVALFLLGLPLGALTLLMVHRLTGGRWGAALRGPLRAIVATLPLPLFLLLPVLAGTHLVFPWAGVDPATLPEAARHKLVWLAPPWLALRFVACAAVWLALAWAVLGWRPAGDAGDAATAARERRSAALGLVVHALAVTVLSIDWMMSLEPEFHSTIYAMLEAAGEVAGACALAMVLLALAVPVEGLPGGGEDATLGEDVANMQFGFVAMWAYLAFMQWLIVWAADLPREIHWYMLRGQGGWLVVLWLMVALHFALPAAGFLARPVKRSRRGFLWLGAAVLAGHFLDVWWRVRPPLAPDMPTALPFDLAAVVGAGGLWAALLLFVLADDRRLARWRARGRHV
jgi:hypothetical protein